MSALAILTTLHERGINIMPKGSKVRLTPADKVTPDLVDTIKAEKLTLLRALKRVRR